MTIESRQERCSSERWVRAGAKLFRSQKILPKLSMSRCPEDTSSSVTGRLSQYFCVLALGRGVVTPTPV